MSEGNRWQDDDLLKTLNFSYGKFFHLIQRRKPWRRKFSGLFLATADHRLHKFSQQKLSPYVLFERRLGCFSQKLAEKLVFKNLFAKKLANSRKNAEDERCTYRKFYCKCRQFVAELLHPIIEKALGENLGFPVISWN